MPYVSALRFDFEGVDVPAMFKEFQDTEKRIKELKEKGGIQRQVRVQHLNPSTWLGCKCWWAVQLPKMSCVL
jgi:hypothetical protein